MAKESVRALEGVALELRSPYAMVEQLSGGQRQGVAIARAMYFKTKLMILDEPTNNLSVKESHKILDFVKDLKAQGVSSIFITHNLQHVYPVADKIVVLSHGVKIGDFRRTETSVEELTSLIVQG
jgi:simple sugar transport system ATP-binding protein